jgi:hypothetical protein
MPRPHAPSSAAPTDVLALPARRTATTARPSAAAHQTQLLHRVRGLIRSDRVARPVASVRTRG